MIHVTCDSCGRQLRSGDDQHFVVRIEVKAVREPDGITEADLDEDHMEAISQLLQEMEHGPGVLDEPEPPRQQLRYDLCPTCRKRFLRDPLGKDVAPKHLFSKN